MAVGPQEIAADYQDRSRMMQMILNGVSSVGRPRITPCMPPWAQY
jgi:hypothetical protein